MKAKKYSFAIELDNHSNTDDRTISAGLFYSKNEEIYLFIELWYFSLAIGKLIETKKEKK